MLLVIVGAGASYDSVPHLRPPGNPDRPPLANELFADRPEFVKVMERFGSCRPHIPSLRKDGVAVERVLAELQSQAAAYPKTHSELAAILYYIRYAIYGCEERWKAHHSGITNYVTLLREIDRWRHEFNEQVLFVTFNYDTMLESAIEQEVRFMIGRLNDYVNHADYRLIKLHGSTNWGRVVGLAPETYIHRMADEDLKDPAYVSIYQNSMIDDGENVTEKLTDQFELVHSAEILLSRKKELLFPAIALPIDKKDEFSCPDYHVTALADWIPQVDKIVTIGWRATETKFLDMLANRLTGLRGSQELLIVSGNVAGADETFKNLGSRITHSTTSQSFEKGFSGLIVEDSEEFITWLRTGKKGSAISSSA